MERVFRRGLALFRWGAWLWVAASAVIYWKGDYFRHHAVAVVMLLLALCFTVLQTALVPLAVRFQNRKRVAALELLVAIGLMTIDGYVRRKGIAFDAAPSLGGWWPVIALFNAATFFPRWFVTLAGALFGPARFVSITLNGITAAKISGSNWLSLASTGLFAALAAYSISALIAMLREGESEVALVRARESVARTLHDGVLQTLAIVARQSSDASLAKLAKDQERDLRTFLFGASRTGETRRLGLALQGVARKFEETHSGVLIDVIVAPDIPELPAAVVSALSGAVGEALTNASKHGAATSTTIYVEPSDEADPSGVFCSVKDNGQGFDQASFREGTGISGSIRGRIQDVGGRVEVKSVPGNGVEVLMWVP